MSAKFNNKPDFTFRYPSKTTLDLELSSNRVTFWLVSLFI